MNKYSIIIYRIKEGGQTMATNYENSFNNFITSIIRKAKDYDKVKEENDNLKRKLADLQSANDGYREVLAYKDSIIDRYGECVGRLCGVTYDKQGSASISEDLIDVLEVISTDERAMTVGDIFREEYQKSHPYETYNPAFDIELLRRNMDSVNGGLKPRFNNLKDLSLDLSQLQPKQYYPYVKQYSPYVSEPNYINDHNAIYGIDY